MLLGYRPETGNIEFLFSDSSYLKKQFPNNTAKISNFWKMDNHGLKEFFVDDKDFQDYNAYKLYKIVDNKIVKKTPEEIELILKPKIRVKKIKIPNIDKNALRIPNVTDSSYIRSLEERIKKLENK